MAFRINMLEDTFFTQISGPSDPDTGTSQALQ